LCWLSCALNEACHGGGTPQCTIETRFPAVRSNACHVPSSHGAFLYWPPYVDGPSM
jgi:hypothetical protein